MPGTGRAFPTGETTVLEVKEGSTTMRVLFADVIFEKGFGRAGVSLEGHEVRTATPETLFDELPRAEVVILPPLVFGEKHLAAAPNLRLVQQWGVGVENIDLAACRRRNVPVCNVPSRERETGRASPRWCFSISFFSPGVSPRARRICARGGFTRHWEARSGANGPAWWDWAIWGTASSNAFSVSA
jgi:hypothetical protein